MSRPVDLRSPERGSDFGLLPGLLASFGCRNEVATRFENDGSLFVKEMDRGRRCRDCFFVGVVVVVVEVEERVGDLSMGKSTMPPGEGMFSFRGLGDCCFLAGLNWRFREGDSKVVS